MACFERGQDGSFILWRENVTTDPYVPPEILDYVVGILYDEPLTPRTGVSSVCRRHKGKIEKIR